MSRAALSASGSGSVCSLKSHCLITGPTVASKAPSVQSDISMARSSISSVGADTLTAFLPAFRLIAAISLSSVQKLSRPSNSLILLKAASIALSACSEDPAATVTETLVCMMLARLRKSSSVDWDCFSSSFCSAHPAMMAIMAIMNSAITSVVIFIGRDPLMPPPCLWLSSARGTHQCASPLWPPPVRACPLPRACLLRPHLRGQGQ